MRIVEDQETGTVVHTIKTKTISHLKIIAIIILKFEPIDEGLHCLQFHLYSLDVLLYRESVRV